MQANSIKASKLERAMGKLSGLSLQQRTTVQALAASIVNQLLHEPISTLNELAGTPEGRDYALMVQRLFRLQPDHETKKSGETWQISDHVLSQMAEQASSQVSGQISCQAKDYKSGS